MVPTAQGDGELVTDLASQGAALSEPQVVGICGPPAADQAGALRYGLSWSRSPNSSGLWQGQQALVDCPRRVPGAPHSGPTALQAGPPEPGARLQYKSQG